MRSCGFTTKASRIAWLRWKSIPRREATSRIGGRNTTRDTRSSWGEIGDAVVGWASLNRFSHRCAHDAIADLSVYVARSQRGRGFGKSLLEALEVVARTGNFHKVVLHALDENEAGRRLYRSAGFAEVGVFRDHGLLDGRYVDVVAMEKLL